MVVQKGLFSINYTIQRCSNLNLGRMFIQKSLSAYRSAFSKFPSRCGTYQRATKQTQIGLLIHNNTPGLACATGGYDLKFGFKLLQQKYSKSGQGNIQSRISGTFPVEGFLLHLRNGKGVLFLQSYGNTSGSLGEQVGMLREHEPQAKVSTAFQSSP